MTTQADVQVEQADREAARGYLKQGIVSDSHPLVALLARHRQQSILAYEATRQQAMRNPPSTEAWAQLPERERSLSAIADEIGYWIKWATRHDPDAPVTPDTHVILSGENAPPHWPSVSQLTRWLEVLRDHQPEATRPKVDELVEAALNAAEEHEAIYKSVPHIPGESLARTVQRAVVAHIRAALLGVSSNG